VGKRRRKSCASFWRGRGRGQRRGAEARGWGGGGVRGAGARGAIAEAHRINITSRNGLLHFFASCWDSEPKVPEIPSFSPQPKIPKKLPELSPWPYPRPFARAARFFFARCLQLSGAERTGDCDRVTCVMGHPIYGRGGVFSCASATKFICKITLRRAAPLLQTREILRGCLLCMQYHHFNYHIVTHIISFIHGNSKFVGVHEPLRKCQFPRVPEGQHVGGGFVFFSL
jgi:hypothetical protein